jgi:acetyltransferase-like isoleucine patch superfamily enzyme
MVMSWKHYIQAIDDGLRGLKFSYFISNRSKFGHFDKTARIFQPGYCIKQNVYMYKHTVIHEYHKLIAPQGKFILKDNSVAAAGLTVITCNHRYKNIGDMPNGQGWTDYEIEDVIVEEQVWMGANVTLCPGVHLNRGIIVAAGAVCVKSKYYPPYSIVGGNPATFIKFKFTLKQQLEHERICFAEEDRLSISLLEKNYNKFMAIRNNKNE